MSIIDPEFTGLDSENKIKISLTQTLKSFKLVIPAEIERKIQYLCSKIPDVEWSGTLFYRHKGSWEDNTLEIVCADIFVMDIGSSTYTEFDVSPDVVSYMCDHPELMEYQMGLIHSHNNMATFFSGTDLNTLRDEGSKRNHFVSLIVNNAGIYTAGITRKIKYNREIQEVYSYDSFNDTIKTGDTSYREEKEAIEWNTLEIIKEVDEAESFDELNERLATIKEAKDKASKEISKVSGRYFNDAWTSYNPAQLSLFDDRLDEPEYKSIKTIPDKFVRSALLQLITGSLVIADDSKIDPVRWAKTMEKLFDRRFPDMKMYRTCMEGLSEIIVLYPPKELGQVDEFLYAEEMSEILIKKIMKLPKNKYLDELIDVLQTWTIEI